jgi:phosphoglycerate dehydrogenase-like enzyme
VKICLSETMADLIGDDISALAQNAELVRIQPDGTCEGDAAGSDVFLFSVDLAASDASLAAAWSVLQLTSLDWVQSPGAGMDMPIWADLVDRGVRVSNAAGVHAEPIAQYIFTYILHWHRCVARHQLQQTERRWEPITSEDLTSLTLGIVGFGGIGQATARVAKAFGMRVLALRRSEIDDVNVDEAYGPGGLITLLEQSDYVVLSTPLNEATRHLIDVDAFAAMKRDAVLINVARGGVVDQTAMIEALESLTIRGATLDVVVEEPLPPDSPLWGLDNCIITPHDAGYSPLAGERLGRLFLENLGRFVAGQRMRNEVYAAELR